MSAILKATQQQNKTVTREAFAKEVAERALEGRWVVQSQMVGKWHQSLIGVQAFPCTMLFELDCSFHHYCCESFLYEHRFELWIQHNTAPRKHEALSNGNDQRSSVPRRIIAVKKRVLEGCLRNTGVGLWPPGSAFVSWVRGVAPPVSRSVTLSKTSHLTWVTLSHVMSLCPTSFTWKMEEM